GARQTPCYSAPAVRMSTPRSGGAMNAFVVRIVVLAVLALVASPAAALAKTEIQWWHAMQGVLGERVNEIAAKFNASQPDYEVKAVLKGSYPETLTAAIAAYRAKQPPQIVQ